MLAVEEVHRQRDDVGFRMRLEKPGHLAQRIARETVVRVEKTHISAPHMPKALVARRGYAAVFLVHDDDVLRMRLSVCVAQRAAFVGRAVVDQNQLHVGEADVLPEQ